MTMRSPIYKTVLVGEGGVGKTSLTVRYTENRFDEKMKMTIGVNFASKKVSVGNMDATLMLWDMGGQPRFRDVVSDYFRGAKMAIAVYDATRYFSMVRLKDWLRRVNENAPDCRFFFVANKVDERSGSGVSYEEGAAFAQLYNVPLLEVSAKTGAGVDEMFEAVTRLLLNQ
jgi:small GTP-binding protein